MQRKADPYWAEQFGLPPSPSGLYGPEPGDDFWRCGCDRCEYRVDFWGRDQAEEAARVHNAQEHRGKPEAVVNVASFWRSLSDLSKDSNAY
jgi:hypothetical protein